MKIGGFNINEKVFIIAELSANHAGDIEIAKDTVRAAAEAGADAIKLQTYTPDTLTIDCDNEHFQISSNSLWDGRTLYDLYQEAYTPWEWHKELFDLAKAEGLICFSSPFDSTAIKLLASLDAPAYKIASFEIQDIPLISEAAKQGKPIILSTGIATLEDIELAIETCKKAGNNDIVVLKCTSSYPAPIELANLKTMVDYKRRFNIQVGLSDHTYGTTVPIVAVSLGARIIEKHFILDKKIGGPDADFSLDLKEFKQMVKAVRDAEKSLGEVTYQLSEKVKANRQFSRSLFAVEDIAKGELLTKNNVRSIRPGFGLHPKFYNQILGNTAKKKILRGTPLSWDNINKSN